MREITFFCDNDLGRKLFPQALREQGLKVETLAQSFSPSEKDRHWLPIAGQRGWVVLTADYRMRYREMERDAIMEHGVRVFILKGHHHQQRVRYFLDNLHRIEHFLRTYAEAFMAKVYRDRVEMWLQYEKWKRVVGLEGDVEEEEDHEEP